MKKRVITSVFGIPLVLAFIWFEPSGFPLFLPLVVFFGVIGTFEFYRFGKLTGARPLKTFGLVGAALLLMAPYFEAVYDYWYISTALVGALIVISLAWLLLTHRHDWSLSWAWTVAGMLYTGWLLGHATAIRELDSGREWVVLVLFSTFACDTMAFFVGRTWGRHPFAPVISPKKTWEGALGGFLAAPAAVLVIRALFDLAGSPLPLSVVEGLGLGLVIGFFAQAGDLLESALKRRAGTKDSGTFLPGHGGVLDRIDSLIITAAISYYYIAWFILINV